MDSPITHEKIIEVLREIVEANDQYRSGLIDGWTDPMDSACDRARDLYQRLQAEKEGGWQPTHWIAAAGAKFERVTQAWCPDIPGEMVVFRNRDGRHFVRPLDTFNSLYTPLNQEGGDAAAPGPASADRPHVAPPASANAGTGRATAVHNLLAKHEVIIPGSAKALYRDIETLLASEHQRGKAEGERIEREVVASWMIAQGFATGHGDTTSDLLSELADGIADRVSRSERIGIEKAAKWHDDQIAIIEKQVTANSEYLKRHTGAMRAVVAANDSCSRHQTEHRLSAAAIRALTGDPQT